MDSDPTSADLFPGGIQTPKTDAVLDILAVAAFFLSFSSRAEKCRPADANEVEPPHETSAASSTGHDFCEVYINRLFA
jgi:hypothetical protein